MNRNSVPLVLLTCYVLFLFVLGIRPYTRFYDTFMPGLDAGGWNMYPYRIDSEASAYLLSKNGSKIEVPLARYFWHKPLIDSGHPHLRAETVQHLARFLAKRPEVALQVPSSEQEVPYKLRVEVRYRKNSGPIQIIQAEESL